MAINLQKGQKIDLTKKSGNKLTNCCVGLNWGAIDKKVKGGLFGLGKEKIVKEAVDLDASCVIFNAENKVIDIVFFKKLFSEDRAIIHSGDDRTGDMDGDDGLDNEVITVDFTKLHPAAEKIVFFLNSYEGHDFATVPFATLRIYEGTPSRVNEVFATYDIANDAAFRGHVSMVMGSFYKRNGDWKFNAIGEATRDRDLRQTVVTIANRFV